MLIMHLAATAKCNKSENAEGVLANLCGDHPI